MVLLASCASVGQHDAEKPAETAVINLMSPSNEGRREDDSGEVLYEHFEDYDENYSGDEAELPKGINNRTGMSKSHVRSHQLFACGCGMKPCRATRG